MQKREKGGQFPSTVPTAIYSLILLAARTLFPGGTFYLYLVGNVVLAWIPFWLAHIGYKHYLVQKKTDRTLGVLLVVAILFLPNSFYIITDFVHINMKEGYSVWFDILVTASFAWLGMLLGFIALRKMHLVVRGEFGEKCGWWFVGFAILLSSVGMYLGRVPRFNSWDVVAHPIHFVSYLASHIGAVNRYPPFMAFVLAFALFLGCIYITVFPKSRT